MFFLTSPSLLSPNNYRFDKYDSRSYLSDPWHSFAKTFSAWLKSVVFLVGYVSCSLAEDVEDDEQAEIVDAESSDVEPAEDGNGTLCCEACAFVHLCVCARAVLLHVRVCVCEHFEDGNIS